jgi:hypothetical protein
MPNSQLTAVKRPRFLAILVLGALAGILMLGTAGSTAQADDAVSPAPAAESSPTALAESCPAARLCVWTGAWFTGGVYAYTCTTIAFSVPETYSAKNHCGNSYNLGWREGGVTNWKICMNPGGERPEPGRLNYVQGRTTPC